MGPTYKTFLGSFIIHQSQSIDTIPSNIILTMVGPPRIGREDHRHQRRGPRCIGIRSVASLWWCLLLMLASCGTMRDDSRSHRFLAVAWVLPPIGTGHGRTASHGEARSRPVAPHRTKRRSQPDRIRSRSRTRTVATAATPATEPDGAATASTNDLYGVATQLLDLVLEQRTEDLEKSLFEAWKTKNKKKEPSPRSQRIESLIEQLTLPTLVGGKDREANNSNINSNNSNSNPRRRGGRPGLGLFARASEEQPSFYDPTESLFGGFYCTLYFYYPNAQTDSDGDSGSEPPEDPIWEKTSLLPSNIKGQQYYIRNDFRQSVINYSEIWGPGFAIAAEGVLTPEPSSSWSWSASPPEKNGRSLRRLPDVFRVDATQISVSLFGGALSWRFDIEGSSADLVVLYADPRLRVFVSPLPSETRVGNWEEAGLVVVQVRSDLVPTKNERTPKILDLR